MDPKIALLLEMERCVWSHIWQNLTGLTEEEYRWRPLPQANDINWILRHLAGYERYCGNIVRGVDVGREHWPDAPFPQIKRDLEALAAEYQRAIAPLRWDDLIHQVPYGRGRPRRLNDLLSYHPLHTSGHRFQIRYIRGTHARLTGRDKSVFDPG